MTGPTSRYGGYPPPRIPVGNIDGNLPGSRIDGDIADENVPGVRTTVNNIANKIFGWEGQRTHQESADALESIKFQMVSNAQGIQDILNTQTPGVLAVDDFNRNGSNLGPNWYESYNSGAGYLATHTDNGGETYWVGSGSNSRRGTFLWQGLGSEASNSEYQDVSVIFNSAPAYYSDSMRGLFWLVVRAADTQNYGFLSTYTQSTNQRRWVVGTVTNGTFNNAYSGDLPAAIVGGSVLRILAGDKSANSPNIYKAYFNSQLLSTWVSSAFGKRWGFACECGREGVLVVSQTSPGRISQWQGKDQ